NEPSMNEKPAHALTGKNGISGNPQQTAAVPAPKLKPIFPRGLTGMPEIISRIHWHDGMKRGELDKAITKELEGIWIAQLSEPEKAKIAGGKWSELPHQAWSRLDRTIVKQAETLGWRLLVSTLVLKSFRRWTEEATGPELFEALGKALARSVRILQ